MRERKAVVSGGEIVEGDALEGDHVAALLIWANRRYPPLLRINPRHVTLDARAGVMAWAYEAVANGQGYALLRVRDMTDLAIVYRG